MNIPFQQVQQDFCQWLRDPAPALSTSVQGVAVDRMQVYRELLFNNVVSFIDMVFPVARSLLQPEEWEGLQQAFFSRARCQSPFYLDISKEFLDYLQQEPPGLLSAYPWLIELLHVEWMELHVEVAPFNWPDSQHILQLDALPDLDSDTMLAFSIPLWVLAYRWPVYHWREGMTLANIQETPGFIMVWRDTADQRCQQLLPPAYALIIDYMLQVAHFSQATLQQGLTADLAGLPQPAQKELLEQVIQYLAGLGLLRLAVW